MSRPRTTDQLMLLFLLIEGGCEILDVRLKRLAGCSGLQETLLDLPQLFLKASLNNRKSTEIIIIIIMKNFNRRNYPWSPWLKAP